MTSFRSTLRALRTDAAALRSRCRAADVSVSPARSWTARRILRAPKGAVYLDGQYYSVQWARKYAPLDLRARIVRAAREQGGLVV